MQIVEIISINKENRYSYSWKLTKKGEDMVESNIKLKNLFEENKLKELYSEITGV